MARLDVTNTIRSNSFTLILHYLWEHFTLILQLLYANHDLNNAFMAIISFERTYGLFENGYDKNDVCYTM